MAQLLKALAILTEDPGSVPSAHMVAPNSLHLQLQGIRHSLLTSTAPELHRVHVYTDKTLTLIT